MSTNASLDRFSIIRLTRPRRLRDALADDVRTGLTGASKQLPPIYFYDARGSELFEQITQLEEYYLTRAEAEILTDAADEIVGATQPQELLELGSGSSVKTDLLLAAMHRAGDGQRYLPLEISEDALVQAGERLVDARPWVEVRGYVGDFHHDLGKVPRAGRRLLAFLGSTLGNLLPGDREGLVREIAGALTAEDALLLGVDLVKDPEILVRAYDDAEGVTAAFNRNVLHVINRELDADLDVEAFAHEAHWDPAAECIEMRLVAQRDVVAHVEALDLQLRFDAGEHIVTEHSCKFRVASLRRELAAAGLRTTSVHTDSLERFAVVLARPDV